MDSVSMSVLCKLISVSPLVNWLMRNAEVIYLFKRERLKDSIGIWRCVQSQREFMYFKDEGYVL